MKIKIGFTNVDNDWDNDTLEIKPLGWPDFYLHTRYGDYLEITIEDMDWKNYHSFVTLEIFNEFCPETKTFALLGKNARIFYQKYLNHCRKLFDDIVKKSEALLVKHGWNKYSDIKPKHGEMCEIAMLAQHELDDTHGFYKGFHLTTGKYNTNRYAVGYGAFEVKPQIFYGAEYWKYPQDDY